MEAFLFLKRKAVYEIETEEGEKITIKIIRTRKIEGKRVEVDYRKTVYTVDENNYSVTTNTMDCFEFMDTYLMNGNKVKKKE